MLTFYGMENDTEIVLTSKRVKKVIMRYCFGRRIAWRRSIRDVLVKTG